MPDSEGGSGGIDGGGGGGGSLGSCGGEGIPLSSGVSGEPENIRRGNYGTKYRAFFLIEATLQPIFHSFLHFIRGFRYHKWKK